MPTIYCRHIRPSGRRCQSFALRNKPFCYHHENINAHHRMLHPPNDGTVNLHHPITWEQAGLIKREALTAEYFAQSRGPIELQFPALEDASSVQLALSMLLTALGQNRIETKRASTILYALQVASANARYLPTDTGHVVTGIEIDDAGNLLSPDEDPEEEATQPKTLQSPSLRLLPNPA